MAIYEITADQIRKIPETTYSLAGLRERYDLQRLLRSQFDVISPDTLIIAEEFGEWEASHRRIDLLGIDKNPNLVIVELKRTEDGGHMELQAIRYAAMVSAMTFEQAVEVYANLLLGPAYRYSSADEACLIACGRGCRAVNRTPSYNGPCIGRGCHYRCQSGGRFTGVTVSCCPCCQSDGDSAERIVLCRYHEPERREKGSSLNSAFLTPKPPASSVHVRVFEAPSPLKRSMSVMSPFPSANRSISVTSPFPSRWFLSVCYRKAIHGD